MASPPQAPAHVHDNTVHNTSDALPTEARNPASEAIDRLPTLDMLRLIHDADRTVAAAVAAQLPAIAAAVDAIALCLAQGGRLFYIGAGTSGRLGVLDASECPPTYNVPLHQVQAILAGGDQALRLAVENVEDDASAGAAALAVHALTVQDAVVGITTSGGTPYVLGALEAAARSGALTIALTCVAASPVTRCAALAIAVDTGPEVITGSTRMKAGTATKMVLNMLSTGVMVRLGHVYSNLMVNVQPVNGKLRARAREIVSLLTGLDASHAADLLQQAGSVKTAVVMHRHALTAAQAEAKLALHHGDLRQALEDLD